MNVLQIKL